MNLQVIAGPLVGSVIGYCTNYVAVKMLFRPLKPVYIGKHKLPFTPGIIPAGKERLAKAVGSAVGGTLLTGESIKEVLLSENIIYKLKEEADRLIKEQENNTNTIKETAVMLAGKEKTEAGIEKIEQTITEKIMDKANSLHIGDIIAEQVISAIKEKVKGMPLIAMVANDNLLNSFAQPIADKIDYYIIVNGHEIVYENIAKETEELCGRQIGELAKAITENGISVGDLVVKAYKKLVEEKAEGLIEQLNLAKIVEDKILSMDVLEVEELLLSVMKKELNAIVNLGAVIGFILGCINIFI